jgi:cytochrome c peroxidase
VTSFQKIFFSILIPGLIVCNCNNQPKDGFEEFIPDFIKDSIYLNPENRFSNEKAALGRYLFYDRRLSVNNTKACASCHAQEFSFADNYNRSIGALGDLHRRNAKPLINIVFEKYLTAADSSIHFPETQINNPMFNEHPVEMGVSGNEEIILNRIKKDKYYNLQFKKAFPEAEEPVSFKNIQYNITSFIKTILSFNSAYDNYLFKKDNKAMSNEQLKGMKLFFSTELACSSCHGGINFSAPSVKNTKGAAEFFFNTGLFNTDNHGGYPSYDQGLADITKNPADIGKYKVPLLRNLAFTAPYFHDGSAATLYDVLEVYESGGRNVLTGTYKGDGRNNPYKHPLIKGFKLNSQERKELISFLLSLSDSSVLKNPAYANPFSDDETTKK